MFRRAATSAATSAARKVSHFLAPCLAPACKSRSTETIRSRFYRDPSLWTTLALAPGDSLLSKSKSKSSSSSGKPVFFLCRYVRNCSVLTPVSLEDDGSFSSKYSIRIIFPEKVTSEFGRFYGCNGLFCYLNYGNQELFVWNPATLESRKLPESPHNKAKAKCDDGLEKIKTFVATWADDPDYKVLRFYSYFRRKKSSLAVGPTEVELYSLKTNSWKKIIFSETLARCGPFARLPRCCINGVLYTTVMLENQRRAMISFDFRSEAFSAAVPLPKFSLGESFNLLEYNGELSLITCMQSPQGDWTIILQWVLRNGEWVRVAQYGSCCNELEPLAFARNGEFLLFEAQYQRPKRHQHLMVLDTTTGELKQVPGLASGFFYELFDYEQTFINLRPPSSGEQEEEAQVKYLGEFEFGNFFDDDDDDDDYDYDYDYDDDHR